MPASVKIGKNCKVTLGTNSILGMGTWSLSGITADELECSEFGDNWKRYEFGMKDGGTISFSGFFDPADVTGQNTLRAANVQNTDVTTLRLYVDNTSYFEPCRTTQYFGPGALSTGYDTFLSHVNITSYNVSADKSGLMNIEFTGRVTGVMVLV